VLLPRSSRLPKQQEALEQCAQAVSVGRLVERARIAFLTAPGKRDKEVAAGFGNHRRR
jgi:hypothetical protein